MEWTWITVLHDFVSVVETTALIAAGCRAGYFWGFSAVFELGDGFIDFENDYLR